MSRNEIRLRRQRLTARGTERFRNYGEVLERHEQEQRLRKIVRVFTLFAVILIVVMLLIIVSRVEKRVLPTAFQATHSRLMKSGTAPGLTEAWITERLKKVRPFPRPGKGHQT